MVSFDSPHNIGVIHDDGLLQEIDPRVAVPRQGKLLSVEVDLKWKEM